MERTHSLEHHVYWQIPEDFEGILNYNPRHDIQDYLDLQSLNGLIPPPEYSTLLIQTNKRTFRQLEKAIGERFGVEKSTIQYFIGADGKLHSEDYPDEVIDRYEKGRNWLAQNGSTDTERENAEIEGMKTVQDMLKDPLFSPYESIVMISPPSGMYEANYFDVYTKKTKRIFMARYHSTQSLKGFLQAAQQIDPNFQQPTEDNLTPAYFLKRPILSNHSSEKILKLMEIDTTKQQVEVNAQIIEACIPFFLSYIQALVRNPQDIGRIKLNFNAILSTADEAEIKSKKIKAKIARAFVKNNPTPLVDINQNIAAFAASPKQVMQQGTKEIKTVSKLPCPGDQKAFKVNLGSIKSTMAQLAKFLGAKATVDFAQLADDDDEDEDTNDFACGGTKKDKTPCIYIVKYGSGIRKCPECGNEAKCA